MASAQSEDAASSQVAVTPSAEDPAVEASSVNNNVGEIPQGAAPVSPTLNKIDSSDDTTSEEQRDVSDIRLDIEDARPLHAPDADADTDGHRASAPSTSIDIAETEDRHDTPEPAPLVPAHTQPPPIEAMAALNTGTGGEAPERPTLKSWRSSNPHYSREEIFLDVHETCTCHWSPDNETPTSVRVSGRVVARPRLSGLPECKMTLKDENGQPAGGPPASGARVQNPGTLSNLYFHPCVVTSDASNDRAIDFVPPDSGFELLRYSVADKDQNRRWGSHPYRVIPLLEETSPVDLVMKVQITRLAATAESSAKKPGRNVLLQIAAPRDVSHCDVEVWDGSLASYAAGTATQLNGSGSGPQRIYDANAPSANSGKLKGSSLTCSFSRKEPAAICCFTIQSNRKYPLQLRYHPESGLFTCFAENFALDTSIVVRLNFKLTGLSTRNFPARPVQFSYEVPMCSISKVGVKSLKIHKNGKEVGKTVSKWVRYNVTGCAISATWRDLREDPAPLNSTPGASSPWIEEMANAQTADAMRAISRSVASQGELNSPTGSYRGGALHQLPYHFAEAYGVSEPIIADFVAAGAEITLVDCYGRTPLHIAALAHTARAVNALIMAGSDVSAADHNGNTALHLACAASDIPIAEALLVAGADASIVNAQGQSALDLASSDTCLNLVVKEWASANGKPIPRIASRDSAAFRSWT